MSDQRDQRGGEQQAAPRRKDSWDKADIVVKGLGALLVGGAITGYGIYSQYKAAEIAQDNRIAQFQIAEDNRKAQLIVQTMANRENQASDMRAKMFDTLMTHYFQKSTAGEVGIKSKIRILELIALNFQDAFNPKPLFEELNTAISSDDTAKKELRRAARIVIRKQIESLIGAGGNNCKIKLSASQPSGSISCIQPLQLRLLDVQDDHVELSVGTAVGEEQEKSIATFRVNYFDMPLVDNSRLNELSYAITLLENDPKKKEATVEAVLFPKHYFGGRQRLFFDNLIGQILEDIDLRGSTTSERQKKPE